MPEPAQPSRGVPLSMIELDKALTRGEFVWRTYEHKYYTLERIADEHLLNIELHLMGRSSIPLNAEMNPDNPRWQRVYGIIREEIQHRGLTLKESTGVRAQSTKEQFVRRTT